jgi:hypothetical protein
MASSVRVDFKANTSNFSKGVNAVKAGIAGIAGITATLLAPLAAVAGAFATLGAGFKGISLAADMEATSVAFETMLGSAEDAKAVLADITKLAASTPYGLTDLTQAARSLLAVTDKENLTDTLRMVGDVASASQRPVADLAAMFSKIKGGDLVQGEDLNQLSDALGGKVLQEFQRVLGVDSVKAVRKLGSESKITGAHLEQVFRNLTAKGGMAFNAMAAQSATFNGLLSTLQDGWESLLRAFGKPVMESLKPLLGDGITLLEAMEGRARAFGEAVGRAVSFLRNAFKGGELLSLSGSGLVLAAQSFVNVLVKGFTAAGGVLLNAFTAAGELLFGIFSNSSMWDSMSAKFEAVGLSIQAAIVEATPDYDGKRHEKLTGIAQRKESRESASEHYAMASGRANATLFAAAGDKLKESGKVFADTFKEAPKLFNTDKRMEDLRKRWNALSTPEGPIHGPELPPAAKKVAPTAAPVAPKAAAARVEIPLSSLARIGGAQAATANPLVALHTKTNDILTRIERNTKSTPAAVYA